MVTQRKYNKLKAMLIAQRRTALKQYSYDFVAQYRDEFKKAIKQMSQIQKVYDEVLLNSEAVKELENNIEDIYDDDVTTALDKWAAQDRPITIEDIVKLGGKISRKYGTQRIAVFQAIDDLYRIINKY